MERRINIFISSVMSGELEHDREIAYQVINELNYAPKMFELLPALSASASEAYIDGVRDCDIFILLVWKDITDPVIKEYREARNLNKPILAFCKYINQKEARSAALEAFMKKAFDANRGVVYENYRKMQELRDAINHAVSAELVSIYKEPLLTQSVEEMYELGSDIIINAKRRLAIFQKTPTLLLGARDYISNMKVAYEEEYHNLLKNWIDKNKKNVGKDSSIEFLYVFSIAKTIAEMHKHKLFQDGSFMNEMKTRIRRYSQIEKSSGNRFRFVPYPSEISGPLIVGDLRYAIWFIGGQQPIAISQRNEKISDNMVRMIKVQCQHDDYNLEKFGNALLEEEKRSV